MTAAFSQTLRSVRGDRDPVLALLGFLGALAVAAWVAWAFLARVTLREESVAARVAARETRFALEAPLPGAVASHRLDLGRAVEAGEVLVELDAGAEGFSLEEARARRAALGAEREALDARIAALDATLAEGRAAAQAAAREDGAEARALALAAELAAEELESYTALAESGGVSRLEVLRAQHEAQRTRAAVEAHPATRERRAHERAELERGRLEARAGLLRERAQVEGSLAAAEIDARRLELELERRALRAPAAGVLVDVAPLHPGAWVAEGTRLGTIVARGGLSIEAEFEPSSSVGLVRTGLPARVRLDGFPWSRFGFVAAEVRSVAAEARDGRIRAWLDVTAPPPPGIALQHGMPGVVEVELESVSPAELLLRAAGRAAGTGALAAPPGGGP